MKWDFDEDFSVLRDLTIRTAVVTVTMTWIVCRRNSQFETFIPACTNCLAVLYCADWICHKVAHGRTAPQDHIMNLIKVVQVSQSTACRFQRTPLRMFGRFQPLLDAGAPSLTDA
jgi:hypothetical protein